jgi:hypothetical protein
MAKSASRARAVWSRVAAVAEVMIHVRPAGVSFATLTAVIPLPE